MCKHTSVKSKLQQLTSETIHLWTFTGNKAHLDICARFLVSRSDGTFWSKGFLTLTPKDMLTKTRRLYSEWIIELDHGGFTPLGMSTTGGMGSK